MWVVVACLNEAEVIGAFMERVMALLELTRNFGKEAAMLAGLDFANGRCAAAVPIDSDLQHPPEWNPAMGLAWVRLIHGPSSSMLM